MMDERTSDTDTDTLTALSALSPPPSLTALETGEIRSPFELEVLSQDAEYSSFSDELSDEVTEELDGASASFQSAASRKLNNTNLTGSLDGCLTLNNGRRSIDEILPSHPLSVIGGLDGWSVVPLTREEISGSTFDDIVRELEGLRVESNCLEKSPSDPEAECCDSQWIRELQVSNQHIGQGSFGRVYKVSLDGQMYALKVVEASRNSQIQNIAREARANMLLRHDNVVGCFKCCALSKRGDRSVYSATGGQKLILWILQELCEGDTLDKAIRKPWLYPPGRDAASRERILLDMSLQVANGLDYIHSHGHIHGDLSTNNVLLALPQNDRTAEQRAHDGRRGHEGRDASTTGTDLSGLNSCEWDSSDPSADTTSADVSLDVPLPSRYPYTLADVTLKISDFGRSKEEAPNGKSCRTDTIGTVTFMPPEVLTSGSLKPSSDVYSYGVLLMQLWSGQLPYQGHNFAQIIFEASQGRTPPVPPNLQAPDVIKDLIRECTSPIAVHRPTMREVIDRLSSS